MQRLSEWGRCSGWLQAALDEGGNLWSLDDVRAEVEAGRADFLPGQRCAFVTEVVTYPRARVVNVWLAGGDLVELLSMVTTIEAMAKAAGCDRATLYGRPGWARALRDHGFEPVGTMLRKDFK